MTEYSMPKVRISLIAQSGSFILSFIANPSGSATQGETQMEQQIIPERMAHVQALSLAHGSHEENERAMCVMEAVSWIAGEPWSDAPQCACPVITAFMVSWNDSLPTDADRDRLLKPLIPLIVGTRSTPAVEQRRATMAADWLVRVHTPAWLRVAKLKDQAQLLEALPEITDFANCPSLMPILQAVRKDAAAAGHAAGHAAWDAAWAAARAAAGDAAWDAAGAAAGHAAGDAAGDAARAAAGHAAWDAARDAARAAARAAAGDAAGDAAGAAAGAALAPTVARLQDSAADLVRRMCEVKGDSPSSGE